ncbi:prepilin-type N-terminal cleavage/methylation domain-containing protein [Bacillus tianshenii]|uniref:prepilin-type N-terminal cleavage/methylation domain-containing protein n=1 Tax=Sutcliffiella tianshenii TaxID=1463404 RepID=UPI001CD29064|nr:prepilin-type N-terminal cleavage/methylation domain-containing protein [Bacillus tianshenii]MCA1320536.1 prepilin-type N-terminal cleavage/methylation domain-containing protein [Bacillus tianshenii]
MWRQSRGFTLLEVLAALVVWMMIMTLLLPGLVMINQERSSFKHDRTARQLLTKELEKLRKSGDVFIGKEIESNGISFRFHKSEENGIPAICAVYLDYRKREERRCVYWDDEAG